jgi:hypothetical protein
VALDRARLHARDAGVVVRWVRAGQVDEDWALEVDEERPRHVATGAGAHHTRDVVLRVRRLR